MGRVRNGLMVAVAACTVLVAWATVARAQERDPFAPVSGDAGSATPAGTADASPAMSPVATCEHVTKAVCARQNNSLLLKCGGYVAICVLLFGLFRGWWDRRGTSITPVRFVVAMLLASASAAALVFFDPTRGLDLKCCLESAVFRSEILFQDSRMARAAVLGFAPAVVLFVVVAFAVTLIKKS